MGQPKTIDFFRCTRPVQDRFVAATSHSARPAPLLFWSAPRTRVWSLLAASVALALVATFVLVRGWGNVGSALALHGRAMLAVDAALFSAASYCFVHALAILRALEALPYRPGTYVFPACVVDASGPVLRVWPVAEADAIERLPQPALALRMRGGERVVVRAGRADEVDRADAVLTSHRAELTRALAEEDPDVLAELDPLHHTSVSSPISSTQALTRVAPWWTRLDWLLALVVGTAFGLGLGAMRNASSDERMIRAVTTAASVPLFEQYLARGGRHAAEVREVLLPRAELLDAQAQGSVEALQAFARTHASAKIGPEIEAAMHRAMLAELEQSKAKGTVAALDAFAVAHPDSHLEAEIQAARHVLYARAFAKWKAKARVEPSAVAFVERLLASAEKLGTSCEVRFRFKPSKTLLEADGRISKHPSYPGSEALPTRYFKSEGMRPREEGVATSLAAAFAAYFPADMLSVRSGESLAPEAAPPTGVSALIVDYSIEWAGADTFCAKPRTILASVHFDFDGRFVLPNGAPLQFSLKSWRGPELWKWKNTNVALVDFEQKVYDAMSDRAFYDLNQKLTETLFRDE